MLEKLDLRNKVIMIADDEETNFILFEALLERTNAKLIWVKDGEQACKICSEVDNIDLILMDFQMPKMNGIEAAKKIMDKKHNVPIILQTAYYDIISKDETCKAGCVDIIAKPVQRKLLFKKIRNCIEK